MSLERETVITVDGNEAAALVAFKTNEIIAIYPITPSTPMGELSDTWAAAGERNIWGEIPRVQEMQSEGGAAGAAHGALQAGSLVTTFTASQGLLLMIPNMYKIAGELTSAVFHVTARSLATQALSIFGDHSDVMATRSTGWGILFSNSVQEAMDFALIAQASTLASRIPFIHAFDGFRTSHEVAKIKKLSDEAIRRMIRSDLVEAHRLRGLSPDHPVMRGAAANPDVYFQTRETVNSFYAAAPGIVQSEMDLFAEITGRSYHLFDYIGAPDADRVIVVMGSGAETVEESVEKLNWEGEKVGVVKLRLFRPFSALDFVAAVPKSARAIAVLDRTKEPGAAGEPLYQDIVTAFAESSKAGVRAPIIVGGRYGLSSKEFTPAMVKAVFDNLSTDQPKNHFTVGINDDVTFTSLAYDSGFTTDDDDTIRAVFWGLGSDGTVGANKNSIKIIGEETENYAQGYFVYDSKKSGSVTVSHLRFGPNPIRRPFLIESANFVGVHQFGLLERYPVLNQAAIGATVLINSSYGPDAVWDELPVWVRRQIIERHLKPYVVDAYTLARDNGLGGRINTIMQTAFFKLSGVLPEKEAIAQIKKAIKKTYSKRGQLVVDRNNAAVDAALSHLHEVTVPSTLETLCLGAAPAAPVSEQAPDFVRFVTGEMIAGRGDLLPVSALPVDGTWPTGTTQWEKRGISETVPLWDSDICIECGKCVQVCPHAVIRAKTYPSEALTDAPAGFKSMEAKFKEFPGQRYTIQVSTDDCTGCSLCVEVCPAKDKSQSGRKALTMAPLAPVAEDARKGWEYFLSLPDAPRDGSVNYASIKNVQLLRPLFEFSGACAGCGETPYLKLVSQLFGDRAMIANATGCSSIYGGNLPTTPWAKNADGRGPAWSNSLFEDNAEFGLGMRLTVDHQTVYAKRLVEAMRNRIGPELADGLLLNAGSSADLAVSAQRKRIAAVRELFKGATDGPARDLLSTIDNLTPRSVWIVGGDGWAYDIGYGGLDHVLASGANVNVLVLDTEVYSNTGGQASKSTPRAAIAKFAAGGKQRPKKDLGRLAMSYGNVYVAEVALGAKDQQVIKAFIDAESYDGPSLIIAYSHCVAHGYDLINGLTQQRLAVESGYWPLYRFDPRLSDRGENPFLLDSNAPSIPLSSYIYNESRYKLLTQTRPDEAAELLAMAESDVAIRYRYYQELASRTGGNAASPDPPQTSAVGSPEHNGQAGGIKALTASPIKSGA